MKSLHAFPPTKSLDCIRASDSDAVQSATTPERVQKKTPELEGEVNRSSRPISLSCFNRAVIAASDAPVVEGGIIGFFGSLRNMLSAQNATLVVFPDDRRQRPFGIHERPSFDFVPEMSHDTHGPCFKITFATRSIRRSQIIPDSQFIRSEIYRKYYAPYDLLHQAVRSLDLGGQRAMLVIDRPDQAEDFLDDELDALDMIAGHLERSFRAHRWAPPPPPSQRHVPPTALASDISKKWIDRFDFTPAECRLASSLSKGIGLVAASRELGISINTAKSRLRAIFEKSNTHRQAELVRALLDERGV